MIPVLPRPLLTALAILISLAWIANLAIGWYDPARSVAAVNTIFGIVAGSLFVLGKKDTAVNTIRTLTAKRPPRPPDDGNDES